MTPPPDIARVAARLRTLHRIALFVAGVAISSCLIGRVRVALAAVILVLFLQIFSLEGLRILAASVRETRR